MGKKYIIVVSEVYYILNYCLNLRQTGKIINFNLI